MVLVTPVGRYPRKLGLCNKSSSQDCVYMIRRGTALQAEREVVRHCYSGLDVSGVQGQVLQALRHLMPIDAAFFATADPDTLLISGGYAEEPLAAATGLFLANEYGSDDVNTFRSLATSTTHVASLDDATGHDRASSPRSRDIMGPLGLGDELRAALVVNDRCWGYLCLHRDSEPLGFSSPEAAVLARLGPHIAHALRQAILLHHPVKTAGIVTPGVVLLAADLSLVAITAEAEYLLSLIDGVQSAKSPLPVAVYTVAAALGSLCSTTVPASTPPSARVRTKDGGWLNLHASHLQEADGEGRIAVVVEPVRAGATVSLLLLAYGLSTREGEVAQLVLRGASTGAIVDTLHISHYTVQDHLKRVFDKTGVRSRRELVGRLLGPASP